MPPRVPTNQVRQVYECPTCIYRRSFATSAPRSAIGPESPRYIEVPQPPQQDVPDKKRIKGILPVPREIFDRKTVRGNLDAYVEKRIAGSTLLPDPSKLKDDDSIIAWKQRMADMRRNNLAEGLEALKNRKKRDDQYQARTQKKRQDEREALLSAPEREDERLTGNTLDVNLQALLAGGPLPDPDREKRVAAKRASVRQREAQLATDRQDHLHNLYVQARSYITTEDQLNKAIDDAFGTPEMPVMFDGDLNPFEHLGTPPSMATLLDMSRGLPARNGNRGAMAGSTSNLSNSYTKIVQARLKKMAEELTGGKIADVNEDR
ncbi:hypothetical protein MBLNU457_4448t1 [Dothideomycetes sp. NU457]